MPMPATRIRAGGWILCLSVRDPEMLQVQKATSIYGTIHANALICLKNLFRILITRVDKIIIILNSSATVVKGIVKQNVCKVRFVV